MFVRIAQQELTLWQDLNAYIAKLAGHQLQAHRVALFVHQVSILLVDRCVKVVRQDCFLLCLGRKSVLLVQWASTLQLALVSAFSVQRASFLCLLVPHLVKLVCRGFTVPRLVRRHALSVHLEPYRMPGHRYVRLVLQGNFQVDLTAVFASLEHIRQPGLQVAVHVRPVRYLWQVRHVLHVLLDTMRHFQLYQFALFARLVQSRHLGLLHVRAVLAVFLLLLQVLARPVLRVSFRTLGLDVSLVRRDIIQGLPLLLVTCVQVASKVESERQVVIIVLLVRRLR